MLMQVSIYKYHYKIKYKIYAENKKFKPSTFVRNVWYVAKCSEK